MKKKLNFKKFKNINFIDMKEVKIKVIKNHNITIIIKKEVMCDSLLEL
jgi:hypothetical protein